MIQTRKSLASKIVYFLSRLLIATAILFNFYTYFYPSFRPDVCSWKSYSDDTQIPLSLSPTKRLESRLNSLYVPRADIVADLISSMIKKTTNYSLDQDNTSNNTNNDTQDKHFLLFGDPQIPGTNKYTSYAKKLDIFGNDFYLGHIYNVMKDRLQPHAITVLGDLISSQWIDDEEYFKRARRLMTRLYPQPGDINTELIKDTYTMKSIDWKSYAESILSEENPQYGYENVYSWKQTSISQNRFSSDFPLFINITGNHDIGYSGDTTWQHMARYSKYFGKDNYWIEYNTNTTHSWRIVVLNDMLLDGPALQEDIRDRVWEFLKQVKDRNFKGSTILITHVPMEKPKGYCFDGPSNRYYSNHYSDHQKAGKLRSQNFLKYGTSQDVLKMVFGSSDKHGVILTGHDHEGCLSYHEYDEKYNTWTPTKTPTKNTRVQEITVRSQMGEFSGNSGLLTAHWNNDAESWQYDYTLCPFMIQHVWWASKILLILAVLFTSISALNVL